MSHVSGKEIIHDVTCKSFVATPMLGLHYFSCVCLYTCEVSLCASSIRQVPFRFQIWSCKLSQADQDSLADLNCTKLKFPSAEMIKSSWSDTFGSFYTISCSWSFSWELCRDGVKWCFVFPITALQQSSACNVTCFLKLIYWRVWLDIHTLDWSLWFGQLDETVSIQSRLVNVWSLTFDRWNT